MEQIKQALAQYNVDGEYKINVDNLRSILSSNIPKSKPKRPQSAFFLWKSRNKDYINSKVTEKGRGVIASKAAELWNLMSEEDKAPYNDEVAVLRNEYMRLMAEYREEVVVTNSETPKKSSGRPKLTDEEKAERKAKREKAKQVAREVDVNDTEDEDEEINVEDFTYNGVEYLIDVKNGDIYDPDTEEIVGKKVGDTVTIN